MAERRESKERRRRESFPRWLLWPALGTAAAALIVLKASLVLTRRAVLIENSPLPVATDRSPGSGTSEKGDINNDGTVDILDALALTVIIRDTGDEPSWGDMNDDGRVNLIDVDAIARRAVFLEE